MISSIWKVENTEQSTMHLSAEQFCDLKENGYIEEEYFFSGTSNIYGEDGKGGKEVLFEDAPYTNRFIVRKPQAVEKRSGRVFIEILNTSSLMDLDREWQLVYPLLMRGGDTYIGITSKPVTMRSLRKYDPQRYAPLSWDNPRPCLFPPAELGNFPFMSFPETEDGLFWDMLTDFGEELRKEQDFLDKQIPSYVYLSGWSQSGSCLVTYTNYFLKERYEAGKAPLYDGIFSTAPGPGVVPALNQSESMDIDEGQGTVQFSNVPYLTMHTESDNAGLWSYKTRIPNSDKETLQYRIYDIPGATHDAYSTMEEYFRGEDPFLKMGIYLVYQGKEPNPNDFPYGLAYRAALQSLYDWVEKKILPPEVEDIPVKEDLSNETDAEGIAIGGWRLPEIDAPVCVYQVHATPLHPFDSGMLYGSELPFDEKKLKDKYGSLQAYEERVTLLADAAIEKRLLLAEDRAYCIAHAVKKAGKYGLE